MVCTSQEATFMVGLVVLTLVAHGIRIIRANASPFDESYYAETDSLFQALAARADSLGSVDTVWTGSKYAYGEVKGQSQDSTHPTSQRVEEANALSKEIEMWVYQDTLEKPTAAFPININTASEKDLQALPRIGPSLAKRIVAYRAKQGFLTKEDLKNVRGIGNKTFEKLAPLVVVSPPDSTARHRGSAPPDSTEHNRSSAPPDSTAHNTSSAPPDSTGS